MTFKSFAVLLAWFFSVGGALAQESKTIKTYMAFGLPVDPAYVRTLVDLDLSYALASTLVDWSDARTLKDGLARYVDSGTESEAVFKIRPEAKWSDGTPVLASQVVASFNRAKRVHASDLKSLFEILAAIEAKDPSTVVFKLNRSVGKSQLLHKLTEPMYGVVFINNQGELDLTKTSGPFFLASSSKEELKLVQNPHWFGAEEGMAKAVVIRQPKPRSTGDHDDLTDDEWPNIIASSSIMPKSLESKYQQENFSRWNRNLDRIFFLVPSERFAHADGRQLVLALNKKLDRKILTEGLSGFQLTHQFFPPGYVIADPELAAVKGNHTVPDQFKKKPLQLLAAEGRLGNALQHNLSLSIEKLTGQKPKIRMVPLSEFEKARAEGQYDLLIASIPVNDPNTEGAVSFIFGMNPPLIPKSGNGAGDFRARAFAARTWEAPRRDGEYRKIFTQAVADGCLLPLFHFSSIVIAREGIDLSKVPTTDETVAFSKVRFK